MRSPEEQHLASHHLPGPTGIPQQEPVQGPHAGLPQALIQVFSPSSVAQSWIQAKHRLSGWLLQVSANGLFGLICLQMLLATCFLMCFPPPGSQGCCQHLNTFLYEFQLI